MAIKAPKNFKQQIFEPRLPLKRVNGLLERCDFSWENALPIQLGTKRRWWGNAVLERSVGGPYAEGVEEPLQENGRALAKKEADARTSIKQVLDNIPRVENAVVTSENPIGDTVDLQIGVNVTGRKEQIVLNVKGSRNLNALEEALFIYENTPDGSPIWENTPDGSPIYEDV